MEKSHAHFEEFAVHEDNIGASRNVDERENYFAN